MPLLIDGEIGDKTYTNQKITAKELIAIFELQDVFKKKVIRFQKTNGIVKNSYGEIQKGPVMTSIPTYFDANYQGKSITIRYYKNQVRDPKSPNSMKYLPNRLDWRGSDKTINPSETTEIALFYYLHRVNESSPLHAEGTRHLFKTMDVSKESLAVLLKEKESFNIKNEIISGDIKILRMRLKGLNEPDVDSMEDDVVRANLLSKYRFAERNQQLNQFVDNLQGNGTILYGMIIDAIDTNVIKLQRSTTNTKKMVWKWGESSSKKRIGTDILDVVASHQQDAKTQLVNYLESHPDTFGDALKSELSGQSNSKSLDKLVGSIIEDTQATTPIKGAPTNEDDELFFMGQQSQLIALSTKKGKEGIYWLTEEGLQGALIVKATNTQTYLKEFSIFLATKAGEAVKKQLRDKLAAKYSDK